MNGVSGIYRDGQIVLDSAVSWPEGARVLVLPAAEGVGLDEATWIDTPEGRAELVARMDAVEPLELTPADEAEIAAAREAVKQVTLEAVRKRMGRVP